jgi:glycine dehydrogenase
MAASYAIYHGPEGLKNISGRIHALASTARAKLASQGLKVSEGAFFDTFTVHGVDAAGVQAKAAQLGVNVRVVSADTVGIACGEAHTTADVVALLGAFGVDSSEAALEALAETVRVCVCLLVCILTSVGSLWWLC